MSQFKMLVTNEGKHPASKWAELAADDIVEISAEAPETLLKEAKVFRQRLVDLLTKHHQHMMDHESKQVKSGKHDLDLPYETEEHADIVVSEICALAKGLSFAAHFEKAEVQEHLCGVLNKYFKSAKLVERHHYHSAKAHAEAKPKK